MSDIGTESAPPSEIRNPFMESARSIAIKLDDFVRTTALEPEVQGAAMKLDPYKPDIRGNIPFRSQGFRFWGGIEQGFRWTTYGEPSANIKDFRIPQELRGKGIGKDFVRAWEKACIDEGITDFVATNIKDEQALKFWVGLGYDIPQDQKNKDIPYCVVKKVADKDSS